MYYQSFNQVLKVKFIKDLEGYFAFLSYFNQLDCLPFYCSADIEDICSLLSQPITFQCFVLSLFQLVEPILSLNDQVAIFEKICKNNQNESNLQFVIPFLCNFFILSPVFLSSSILSFFNFIIEINPDFFVENFDFKSIKKICKHLNNIFISINLDHLYYFIFFILEKYEINYDAFNKILKYNNNYTFSIVSNFFCLFQIFPENSDFLIENGYKIILNFDKLDFNQKQFFYSNFDIFLKNWLPLTDFFSNPVSFNPYFDFMQSNSDIFFDIFNSENVAVIMLESGKRFDDETLFEMKSFAQMLSDELKLLPPSEQDKDKIDELDTIVDICQNNCSIP